MQIAGLTIAVIIVVGIIFLFIRSVLVKLFTMLALVFVLILVFALGGDKLGQWTQPLAIDGDVVQIYQDGKPVQFKKSDIRRVDVVKAPEGGIGVTLTVGYNAYYFTVNKLTYEWRMKNAVHRNFSQVLHNSAY